MLKSITLPPTGLTLEYAEQGADSGVPVVFLHGVTDSWRSFEPVLERLPSTVRALALTQRGHGRSDKPAGGYLYSDLAEDLQGFMDALRLPSAIIAGHSMGSMVAQRFALDYPDRVAGLVLMGAFRTVQGDAGVQAYWDSTLSTLEDPVDREVAREFQVSTLARPVPPGLLDTAIEESLLVPARVWRATFRGFLDTPDFSGELNRVKAPTLIVWGDQDAYTRRTDQETLRALIPDSRLLVYPGAGHGFHWEDPGRFAADLVAFLYERRDGTARPEGTGATEPFAFSSHAAR